MVYAQACHVCHVSALMSYVMHVQPVSPEAGLSVPGAWTHDVDAHGCAGEGRGCAESGVQRRHLQDAGPRGTTHTADYPPSLPPYRGSSLCLSLSLALSLSLSLSISLHVGGWCATSIPQRCRAARYYPRNSTTHTTCRQSGLLTVVRRYRRCEVVKTPPSGTLQ